MASPKHEFVLVRHDGTIVRQKGAATVARTAPGVYQITFRYDVQDGAWQATLCRTQLDRGFDEPSAWLIAVYPSTNRKLVEVHTRVYRLVAPSLVDAQPMDSGFFLSVLR